AFAGATTPQQRGNTYTTPIDFDGDGDLDVVVNAFQLLGAPSSVGNGLLAPVSRSVVLGWYPNSGPGAAPQFGAFIALSAVTEPGFPPPTPPPPPFGFGNFVVGDVLNGDGLPDLIHSSGVFASVVGGPMVPAALASAVLLENLDGAVLDLDCSGYPDLL